MIVCGVRSGRRRHSHRGVLCQSQDALWGHCAAQTPCHDTSHKPLTPVYILLVYILLVYILSVDTLSAVMKYTAMAYIAMVETVYAHFHNQWMVLDFVMGSVLDKRLAVIARLYGSPDHTQMTALAWVTLADLTHCCPPLPTGSPSPLSSHLCTEHFAHSHCHFEKSNGKCDWHKAVQSGTV